jgi:hypothetical protein
MFHKQGALHSIRRYANNWFGSNASVQRGSPPPFSPAEKRPAFAMQNKIAPNGLFTYYPVKDYDWGAARYRGDVGQILYDVVGEGWIVPPDTRFTAGMRKTGSYLAGSVFWNTTPQNNGAQPFIGQIYTPDELSELFGQATATAIVAFPNYLAPGGAAL